MSINELAFRRTKEKKTTSDQAPRRHLSMSDAKFFERVVAGREAATLIGTINGIQHSEGKMTILIVDEQGWFLRLTVTTDSVRSTVVDFQRRSPLLNSSVILQGTRIENRLEKSFLILGTTSDHTKIHLKPFDFESNEATEMFTTLPRYMADYNRKKTRQNTITYVIMTLGDGVSSGDASHVRFDDPSGLPTFTAYTSRSLTKEEILSKRRQTVIACHTRSSARSMAFNTCHATFLMDATLIPPVWRAAFDEEMRQRFSVPASDTSDIGALLASGQWTSSVEPDTPRKSPSIVSPVHPPQASGKVFLPPQAVPVQSAGTSSFPTRVQSVVDLLLSHPDLMSAVVDHVEKFNKEATSQASTGYEKYGARTEVPLPECPSKGSVPHKETVTTDPLPENTRQEKTLDRVEPGPHSFLPLTDCPLDTLKETVTADHSDTTLPKKSCQSKTVDVEARDQGRKAPGGDGMVVITNETIEVLQGLQVFYKDGPRSRTWLPASKVLSGGESRLVLTLDDGTTKHVERRRCGFKPP